MDAFLALVSRREVRDYDERPLPEDAVRRILEAGRLAGSSRNRQERRFIAVRDPGVRAALAEIVHTPTNVRGAALVIAVVTRGRGRTGIDAGRAAQNMMIAAWNEGIGSCPNGIANADAAAPPSAPARRSRWRRSSPSASRPIRATRGAARRGMDRARRPPAVRRAGRAPVTAADGG